MEEAKIVGADLQLNPPPTPSTREGEFRVKVL
jgi:hypothetical protein